MTDSNRRDALRLAPDNRERAESYDKAADEARVREEKTDRSDDRDTDSAMQKSRRVWAGVDFGADGEPSVVYVDEDRAVHHLDEDSVYVCQHCGDIALGPGVCHGTDLAYHDAVTRVRVPSE